MDSFDSYSFQSLDHAAERLSGVDEQQNAFVDSLLLPYMQSPRTAMPVSNFVNTMQTQMHAAPVQPTDAAMQQCDPTQSTWLSRQSVPVYSKEEMSMSVMYNMLINRNAQTVSGINASASTPATIMNLLSAGNAVYSSAMGANGNSMCASIKREDSNCSMAELDREYDTASTVSPFSASTDGGISSDEYPTPSVSPLSQSRPAPHIQTQIKLEQHSAAAGHGCDEQFAIEIITPPSTVLDAPRLATSASAVNAPPLKKRTSPAVTVQKKESSKSAELLSQVQNENAKGSRKNSKRAAKRSCESSDESDSDDEPEDEANSSKQAKASASSACSAGGADSKNRLARKAELARMSRRRKKMRLNDLEKEVKRLHEELAQLQNEAKTKQMNGAPTQTRTDESNDAQSQDAHIPLTSNSLLASPSSAVNDEAEYAQLMTLMNDFVNAAKAPEGSVDADGKQRAEGLLDLFVSGHAAFLRSGSMHLNALNHHVQSILPFQFLNWMCTQGDGFYQDPSGLWRSLLVDELHLSAEQLNDMDTFRHTVRKQYKHVVEIHKLFKRMSDAMQKQSAFSLQNMERIRTVLTPQQFAHFIDWVQKFGEICLKMHQ